MSKLDQLINEIWSGSGKEPETNAEWSYNDFSPPKDGFFVERERPKKAIEITPVKWKVSYGPEITTTDTDTEKPVAAGDVYELERTWAELKNEMNFIATNKHDGREAFILISPFRVFVARAIEWFKLKMIQIIAKIYNQKIPLDN